MEIRTVGIVGCGLMGSGIAEVVARKKYSVIVREVNDDFMRQGLARLETSTARAVKGNKMSEEERAATLQRIKGTVKLEDLAPCDIVIEAVSEKLDLKKDVFERLGHITRPEVILASNTSSLPIIEMAAMTNKPDKVLGLHFFSPVPVMSLLEMVRSFLTAEETYQTARSFGESLGKTVIVAKDAPGFIVNALLVPYQLDAIRLYENGFATAQDIDAGIRLGLRHPMGPLELGDFVGLDIILDIADSMFEETKDQRYAAPALLRRMVAAGYLGLKSGKGFYNYPKK
jgi:3-hydroxybutyryl-CoA dehydrogenase